LVANIILGVMTLVVAGVLRLERLAPSFILVTRVWWYRGRRPVRIPSVWCVRSVQISNAAVLSFQRDVRLPPPLSREKALLPTSP
jgi:hypothetical protein